MYIYKTSDICPCCGQPLPEMSERELFLLSELLSSHNIEPVPELQYIEPIDFPPPDAGLNPPVKPKI